MIIKSFVAESASAALKMVRQELGGDAIVLKTRQLPQGRGKQRIEITACVEKGGGQPGLAEATSIATATVTAPVDARAKVAAAGDDKDIVPEPVKKRLEQRPNIAADDSAHEKPSLAGKQSDVPPMEKIIEERRQERERREQARRKEQEKLDAERTAREERRNGGTKSQGTSRSSVEVIRSLSESSDTVGLAHALAAIEHRLDQMLHVTMQWPSDSSRAESLRRLHESLVDSDVPVSFVRNFISRIIDETDSDDDVLRFARNRLAEKLTTPESESITIEPGDTVLFMGPAGSGKSSVMGKLAARLVGHEKMSVRLATLDSYKMGAYEEICSYADVLGVDMIDATESATPQNDVVTLIDAPAVLKDDRRMKELRQKIDVIAPKYRLAVLSAMIRSSDIADICDQLSELEPTHLVVTMLDLTSRYGGVLMAAIATGLPVAFVTDAPGGIGSVSRFDSRQLADRLIQFEVARG